jgi:hypothetical protein
MGRQATCEDRIRDHMESRLADFRAFESLSNVMGRDELTPDDEDAAGRVDIEIPDDFGTGDDRLREDAMERVAEYPLGMSAYTTFRVELSTGGPADWLEVVCAGDTPRYEGGGEPYEVERIVYHFADWFDHAERQLDGPDLRAAEWFVSQVVPELTG